MERPEWENGAFTEAVLDALKGAADGNGDGWITVSELNAHVVDAVQIMTDFAQTPVLSVPGGQSFEAKLFRVLATQ